MATWNQIEKLADELDRYNAWMLDDRFGNPVHAYNAMFDRALALGMDYEEPSLTAWVSKVISDFQSSDGDPELYSVGEVALR